MARQLTGTCDPQFAPVSEALEGFLSEDPSFSAQLCVYVAGTCVVDLAGGSGLGFDEITGVFSVSKGVAALSLATIIDDGSLELDEPVAYYWPEFAQRDKGSITVRQLLSHQAGLPATDGGVSAREVLDSGLGARRLAAQLPLWRPGSMFGYHGLTIGILMEELARRTTGRELQDIYEHAIRRVHDVDFYLGLPAEQDARYRPLIPPVGPTATGMAPDTLGDAAFGRLRAAADPGLAAFSPNAADVRRKGPVAAGGTGSARGLARLYAVALGHLGEPFVRRETLERMAQLHVSGHDVVVDDEMRFGLVFMKPQPRMPFGSYQAFGHDGAGGALAFADPMYDIAFGYIPAPMTTPGGADYRAIHLSQILRGCL